MSKHRFAVSAAVSLSAAGLCTPPCQIKTVKTKRIFFNASTCEGKQNDQPEWAYPHPYDPTTASDRFVNVDAFKKQTYEWDLAKLLHLWETSDGESWPWVWCRHNPNGPHHVFLGISANTLDETAAISKANVRNNLTVIVHSMEDIEKYTTAEQLYMNRCAIIAVPLQQIDTEHKIMMLRDERIICYDFAYLS